MQDRGNKSSDKKHKEPYEKPAIAYETTIETLAGLCSFLIDPCSILIV